MKRTSDQADRVRRRETSRRLVNLLNKEAKHADPLPRTLPLTLGECIEDAVGNTCPHVSCRYHLLLEVSSHGKITVMYPDAVVFEEVDGEVVDWHLDLSVMPHTCAMELARSLGHDARGLAPYSAVGLHMGLNKQVVCDAGGGALARLLDPMTPWEDRTMGHDGAEHPTIALSGLSRRYA